MKLGELIINYRTRMSLSQREFSRKCDLSNSYISFLEKGKNPKTGRPLVPTLEQYKKIADGMDISVHKLFELLDEDAPVNLNSASDETEKEPQPKNDDIRLLVRGLNKLTPEQVDQAKEMFRVMFMKTNPDLFNDEGDDDL